tara:strand:- start:403 stop:1290 length:888 start_codon:yes stop_codon:yes gene_type:complete
MKWFDIIKAPVRQDGMMGKAFNIGDIPFLEDILFQKDVPWENIWPTAKRTAWLNDKDDSFTPYIVPDKGGFGFFAVMNITNGSLVDEGWEMMRTRELVQEGDEDSATEAQWGMGMHTLTLTKNQIGIEVKKYGNRPMVEVTLPKDSNLDLGAVRHKDMMANPQNYQLNHGEAAALGILGIFGEQRNPRLRKQRKQWFRDFKLGELENNSQSPYLRSLDEKGLVEFGFDRDDISPSNRGFPTITMKGYREATLQVDMPRAVFFSEEIMDGEPMGFKAKVLAHPEEPYFGYQTHISE